ncbi:PID-CTERM protein-sorting domain-containing protein [Bernardetia sp. OM2101]|uniref:PID-CTERM protein-sorting domain-containing protein n=1 Tax=Bernardetia sp. OM2101 TaxID=3344876 RepID=UPI0035CED2B8
MYQKIILTLSLFFIVGIALSQPPFPTSNAIGAPIDGGLSLLLAAGAAYGAKKVYDFKNKDGQEEEDEMK